MAKIKEEINDSFCWICVDESTDKCGRAMCNLIVGKLDETKHWPARLIAAKSIEGSIDGDAMARFINENLGLFNFTNRKKENLKTILASKKNVFCCSSLTLRAI